VSKQKRNNRREDVSALNEKTIYINRVAKVVKGGRRFNFSAMVVAGDGEGKVGIGFGKANQVPEAIRKASEKAKSSLNTYPIIDGTVPHIIKGRYSATRVLLRPASPGTGVIASSTVRSILDAVGYQNVLTKVIGSNNPHNVVKATLNALSLLESPEQYSVRTGKPLEEVMENYTVGAHVWGSRSTEG
jgi:small subunit ribosomal protein S5